MSTTPNQIPPYLLADCSPQDRYLIETVFELNEKVDSQKEILTRVENQTTATNGRVTKAEDNIQILTDQIKSWTLFKHRVFKVATNKYFIVTASLAIFCTLYPIAIYVSKSGGIVAMAESIAKAIWG